MKDLVFKKCNIVIFKKCNIITKFFLLRYLKNRGYIFKNNMTQPFIFIIPYEKYAYCCNKQVLKILFQYKWFYKKI